MPDDAGCYLCFFYLVIKCVNQKEEVVTRKSEKQQVIAFIDYENCSNLTEVALNIYTELIISVSYTHLRAHET